MEAKNLFDRLGFKTFSGAGPTLFCRTLPAVLCGEALWRRHQAGRPVSLFQAKFDLEKIQIRPVAFEPIEMGATGSDQGFGFVGGSEKPGGLGKRNIATPLNPCGELPIWALNRIIGGSCQSKWIG